MKPTIVLLVLLLPALLQAQQTSKQHAITGKILTAEQAPIAGATIYNKTGKSVTVTDTSGNFIITLLSTTDTLIITHVGYMQKQVVIAVNTALPPLIILQPVAKQLEDVVVNTGYQDIPKERATGSFEVIGSNTLKNVVSTDILSRLQGTSSILFDKNINRPALTIRGLSTISGPQNPLIIVDNFPYEGNINNINSEDVETVTILKDAAAASIWGTRAGNGVIVITSKKGKYNQPLNVQFSTRTTIIDKPDLFYRSTISSSDFIDVEQMLFSRGFYTSSENNTTRPPLSPVIEILIKQRNSSISASDATAQINALRSIDVRNDFNKYMYTKGTNRQYSVGIQGGSANVASSLTLGIDNNTDPLHATYKRLNLHTDNAFKPAKGLQLTLGINYTQSTSGAGRSPYESFLNTYPYAQLADANGNALPLAKYRTGYTDTAGKGKMLDWSYYPLEDYKHITNTTVLNDLVVNNSAQYQIIKALTAEVRYQYEKQGSQSNNLQGVQSFFTRNMINKYTQINTSSGVVKYNVPKGSILDRSDAMLESESIRGQLNFNKTWGNHTLVAIAGSEKRELHTTTSSSTIYGYNEDIVSSSNVDFVNAYPTYINGSTALIPSNISFGDKLNRFVSLYGNGTYTYNGRYNISASVRKDASNLFGVNSNDKWQPLWSVGTGWNIAKEPFYRSGVFNSLSLRATYGYSGNVDQRKSAVTIIRYNSIPATYTNFLSASILQINNPDLKWEKVSMLNVGLDFTTTKQFLYGSVELYRKKSFDLFGPALLDYTAGLNSTTITKNVADLSGKGIDISLNSKIINHQFKWTTTLIFNYNSTNVTKYYLSSTRGSDFVSGGTTIKPIEGKPVYSILSYKWGGLDSAGNPQGIINGKPSIDYTAITGTQTTAADLVYSGPALPPVYGSFINTFSYKGISITANITYKLGYYFRKQSIAYDQLFSSSVGNADFAMRWQKPGDEKITYVPSMIYPNVSNRDAFYNNSEVLVRKGDHLRLQYINASYSLPAAIIRKLRSNEIQVYVNASDLGIIWRANKENLDPDYNPNIPPSKSLTIGLRANFR